MIVSVFNKGFDRQGFECGVEELDHYLKRIVSQDIRRNSAVCFILHDEGSREILGYYTLSAFSVQFDGLPEIERKALPKYPQIPATMLGRLAIASSMQGRGIGERLLVDALKRAWKNREVIASWTVIVDAINDSAADFYQRYGFTALGNDRSRLYLPMKEIGKLIK